MLGLLPRRWRHGSAGLACLALVGAGAGAGLDAGPLAAALSVALAPAVAQAAPPSRANRIVTVRKPTGLHRYEVGPQIGAGSLARVHEGRDLATGEKVAIKLFHEVSGAGAHGRAVD